MRYLVIAMGGLLGANVRYILGGWIAEALRHPLSLWYTRH
jgi:fluoride ion exporter CrcB/FEX